MRTGHRSTIQSWSGGCQVTTIQKLLGHQRLNSTMIYARVHDRTVAEDYYAAMAPCHARLVHYPPFQLHNRVQSAGSGCQLRLLAQPATILIPLQRVSAKVSVCPLDTPEAST